MSIEKQYVIGNKVTLEEVQKYAWDNNIFLKIPYNTDVFNKKLRTTVCLNAYNSGKVMYCENCDTTHYNKMDIIMEAKGENDEVRAFKAVDVVCKNCGSSYDIEDIKIISRWDRQEHSDARLVYCNIFNDEDNLVKLSIKSCNMLVEKAFFSVDNKYKLIFNAKTGQTFIHTAPEHVKNKVKFINTNASLTNITYRGGIFDVPFKRCLIDTESPEEYKVNIFKELYNMLYEKISRNLGYKPTTLEEYAKEFNINNDKQIYNTGIIALYNRFPNLNPFILVKLEEQSGNNNRFFSIILLNRMKKIKNTSKNPIDELINLYHIKDKEYFIEAFNQGSDKIYEIIYYSSLFKNSSYIQELTSMKQHGKIANASYEVNNLLKRDYSNLNSKTMLFRYIVREYGEEYLYEVIKTHLDNGFTYDFIYGLSKYFMYLKKLEPKFSFDVKEVIEENTKFKAEMLNSSLKNRGNLKLIDTYEEDIFKGRVIRDFNEYLYESNKSKFNFEIKTVEQYYEEFTANSAKTKARSYHDMHSYNINTSYLYMYAPTLNPFLLANMLDFNDYGFGNIGAIEKLPQVILDLNPTSTDVLGDLFRYYNLPNVKSLRNKILSKPRMFLTLVFYSRLFKDVNILNNILDNNCTLRISMRYLDEYLSDENELFIFIKMMINKQGETIVGRKIVDDYKSNSRYLVDSARMYYSYKELYNTEELDIVGNIKEIHDRLVRLTGGTYNTLTKADFKPYKYTNEDLDLVYKYNGYSFDLAKDGKQLVDIGSDLRNCVGSYTKLARKRQCIIVPVSYEDEYKICIELRVKTVNSKPQYELHQAKLYANTPVYKEQEALEAVTKWMEVNNIKDVSSDVDAPVSRIHSDNDRVNQNDGMNEYDDFGFEYIHHEAIPF